MAKLLSTARPKKRIYADAAAATPLSCAARKELLRLLDTYGNAGALHQEAVSAKKELEDARAKIATAIFAHPDEIIFTASGTEGNNLALQGGLRPMLQKLKGGALKNSGGKAPPFKTLHALTSAIEHQSVLEPLHGLAAEGLETTELPVDAQGFVSPKVLAENIRENTVLVSIQLVNSEVGTIEPIRELGKTIRHARKMRESQQGSTLENPGVKVEPCLPLPLLFHSDASQAPFWTKMNVEQLGVDLLTLDGQKVQGPKGVGALYIRRKTLIESVMQGGVQEFNLRAGTPNVPLVGSFAVAFAAAQDSKNYELRIMNVAAARNYLWEEIQKLIPDVRLNGPNIGSTSSPLMRAANNLNISVPGLDGETAVIALNALGVAASTRSACNTGDEDPSHVIKALGLPRELAKTAIRFTLLPTATRAEAKKIATALKKAADLYRR